MLSSTTYNPSTSNAQPSYSSQDIQSAPSHVHGSYDPVFQSGSSYTSSSTPAQPPGSGTSYYDDLNSQYRPEAAYSSRSQMQNMHDFTPSMHSMYHPYGSEASEFPPVTHTTPQDSGDYNLSASSPVAAASINRPKTTNAYDPPLPSSKAIPTYAAYNAYRPQVPTVSDTISNAPSSTSRTVHDANSGNRLSPPQQPSPMTSVSRPKKADAYDPPIPMMKPRRGGSETGRSISPAAGQQTYATFLSYDSSNLTHAAPPPHSSYTDSRNTYSNAQQQGGATRGLGSSDVPGVSRYDGRELNETSLGHHGSIPIAATLGTNSEFFEGGGNFADSGYVNTFAAGLPKTHSLDASQRSTSPNVSHNKLLSPASSLRVASPDAYPSPNRISTGDSTGSLTAIRHRRMDADTNFSSVPDADYSSSGMYTTSENSGRSTSPNDAKSISGAESSNHRYIHPIRSRNSTPDLSAPSIPVGRTTSPYNSKSLPNVESLLPEFAPCSLNGTNETLFPARNSSPETDQYAVRMSSKAAPPDMTCQSERVDIHEPISFDGEPALLSTQPPQATFTEPQSNSQHVSPYEPRSSERNMPEAVRSWNGARSSPDPYTTAESRNRSTSNGSILSVSSNTTNSGARQSRQQTGDSSNYASRYDFPNSFDGEPGIHTYSTGQDVTLTAPTYTPYAPSPSLLGTNDPLGRSTARVPVFSFGFGGKIITCFHGSSALNTGFDVSLSSRKSTDISIRLLHTIIPESALDLSSSYPGPLFSDPVTTTTSLVRTGASTQAKTKKSSIINYLDERAEEISRGFGYLNSGSIERRQAEGKLILVKLLRIMIENEGRLSGR
jgi:hypothetical protein